MYKTTSAFVCFCALLSAAVPTRTYVSPDHTFQLSIPSDYSADSSQARTYIPICRDSDTACIVYTGHKYDRTNFEGASVEVNLNQTPNALSCGIASDQHPTKTIGGIAFVHSSDRDGTMSHDIATDTYLGFAAGKCYEVDLHITFTNFAVYAPGMIKEFTKADHD